MPAWYLYVLRCRDGTLYTGISTDVAARLEAHAAGKGARYTRGRGPLTLLFSVRVGPRGRALSREAAFKRLPRAEKLRLIEKHAQVSPPSAKRLRT